MTLMVNTLYFKITSTFCVSTYFREYWPSFNTLC